MFCPQCKAEYRAGFARCSDCDVDLVEQLQESTDLSNSNLTSAWSGEHQAECVSICKELKAMEVPFVVNQRKRMLSKGVDQHYEISVPGRFFEKARQTIEEARFDFSDSGEYQNIMELPDPDTAPVKHEARNWNCPTKDATVEIWSGGPELKGVAWMVEASLHENGIGTHIDVTQNEVQRIFVRAEDEFQAREIVREIESGAPST